MTRKPPNQSTDTHEFEQISISLSRNTNRWQLWTPHCMRYHANRASSRPAVMHRPGRRLQSRPPLPLPLRLRTAPSRSAPTCACEQHMGGKFARSPRSDLQCCSDIGLTELCTKQAALRFLMANISGAESTALIRRHVTTMHCSAGTHQSRVTRFGDDTATPAAASSAATLLPAATVEKAPKPSSAPQSSNSVLALAAFVGENAAKRSSACCCVAVVDTSGSTVITAPDCTLPSSCPPPNRSSSAAAWALCSLASAAALMTAYAASEGSPSAADPPFAPC